MPYTTIFFDLDDTLYPPSSGIWPAIRDRMHLYLLERLHFSEDEIPAMRQEYLEKYGTTLAGLQAHHLVDTEDYLAYVHDVPLKEFLKPDKAMRTMLLSLPLRRWIFTNADTAHARRVLGILQLEDCFEGIIDIRATEFYCKPDERAYQKALILAGEPDPQQCILVEDSTRNLAPAKAMGFYCILVGDTHPSPAADLVIPSLLDLHSAAPWLWE